LFDVPAKSEKATIAAKPRRHLPCDDLACDDVGMDKVRAANHTEVEAARITKDCQVIAYRRDPLHHREPWSEIALYLVPTAIHHAILGNIRFLEIEGSHRHPEAIQADKRITALKSKWHSHQG
jgi:hypothetical protein